MRIFILPMFFNYETSGGSIISFIVFFFHLSLISVSPNHLIKELQLHQKTCIREIAALAMQK